METGRVWLLETDQQVPRQELTAVGVPGELQIEAGVRCGLGGPRLMGKQHPHRRIRGSPGERDLWVAAVLLAEMSALKSVTPATTIDSASWRSTTCSFSSTRSPSRRSSAIQAGAPE